MGELRLTGLDEQALAKLSERATEHGRTIEAEAKTILLERLESPAAPKWQQLLDEARRQTRGAIRSSSLDLIREGRDALS
jgi:plasmid stability protein